MAGLSTEVVRLRDEENLGFQEIAVRLGLPNRDAASRMYTSAQATRGKPDITDILTFPPKVFKTRRPTAAPAKPRGKWRQTVLFSDTHMRAKTAKWGADPRALEVVKGVIRDVRPATILHGGDLLDCGRLSQKFDSDPADLFTTQDEIDEAAILLAEISEIAPDAEKEWREGNHEQRLQRLILGLPGAHRELAKLRAFQKAMTWPVLMDLASIGWSFVPMHGQARREILPKLITKHGTTVSKWSGHTAKNEWMKYGRSGTSGHTHRLGKFYHNDHNGSHVWVESGCTCKLDPDYMDDPDWQQGLLVITHNEDGTRFNIEDVFIQDGQAIWRDKEYRAA